MNTAREAGEPHDKTSGARGSHCGERFSLEVFGWNLGGSSLDCFRQSLAENLGGGVDKEQLGLLQECPRGKVGWSTDSAGSTGDLLNGEG